MQWSSLWIQCDPDGISRARETWVLLDARHPFRLHSLLWPQRHVSWKMRRSSGQIRLGILAREEQTLAVHSFASCDARMQVCKDLNLARRAGLTWPLPPEFNDEVRLENRLFPSPSYLPSDERPQPDWSLVHRELGRRNVTLTLLWEEYCDSKSDSFSYSCYVAARFMLSLLE
ncbi:hypothetical protein [Bradyrhizobium hipponense]|uniref:hypothetical protein n=1 Tax=Bradyrhizobium hipponense TaxID=2605638 RepID=UPI00165313CC